MPSPYDFSKEAKLTNEQLSGELAKLTPLTAEQLNKLLPKKPDKQRLSQLIDIVNSSGSQNKKLASLTSSFKELGGVVLKLLTKYLKPL
jgi:hypothetical protein